MSRENAALGPRHRRIFYAVTALLWLSGAAWLCLRHGTREEGGALQASCLKVHGAAGMAFLIVFGTLLMEHARVGWRRRLRRPSGTGLLAACAVLILTAWGLYYTGDEGLRLWTSGVHSILGLALPLPILAHILEP